MHFCKVDAKMCSCKWWIDAWVGYGLAFYHGLCLVLVHPMLVGCKPDMGGKGKYKLMLDSCDAYSEADCGACGSPWWSGYPPAACRESEAGAVRCPKEACAGSDSWKDLWPCRRPTLDQTLAEGLHPWEGPHTGVVKSVSRKD